MSRQAPVERRKLDNQPCKRADINQTLTFLQTGDPGGIPVPSYCCDTVPIQSLLIKSLSLFKNICSLLKTYQDAGLTKDTIITFCIK